MGTSKIAIGESYIMANKQMSSMETNTLMCASCGKTNTEIKRDAASGTVFVHCLSCGMEGKKYPTEFQAIRSWNKAALHIIKKRVKR